MDPEKTSKPEERRAQLQHQQQQQQRWVVIGLIVAGAVLVLLAVVWPQLKSLGRTAKDPASTEVVAVTSAASSPSQGMSRGASDAPVTIDVFEDFQCPACKYFTESIESLVIKNLVDPGKVRYVFHVYPFLDGGSASDGGESDQAANAALCANEQGKFWTMHDTLFANWNGENQGAFSNPRLQAMAKSIGLDMEPFKACFSANKYLTEIQADLDLGKQMGVSGTPTVFVNGEHVGQPGKIATYDEIAQAVEQALGK